MKHFSLLISFLTLSACASGPNVSVEHYARVLEPPAEYQRPYTGKLSVNYRPAEIVAKACPRGIACAFPFKDSCVIIINEQYARHAEAILRHEKAHCLGWSGTHPRT